MAARPLSEAQLREVLDACAAHPSQVKAARALGMNKQTFQSRLDRARSWAKGSGYVSAEAMPPKPIQTDSLTVSGEQAELMKVTTARVKSLADLIRVCEIDTNEWEIVSWKCGAYEGQSKDNATSAVTVTQMFTVRASLRLKRQVIEARAEIMAMLEDAARKMPARPFIKRTSTKRRHLLELAIPDLHIGKLAWSAETGHANYDSKIAVKCFNDALDALVSRTASFDFERVVFVMGNDFLHSNSPKGQTYNGTQLDSDSRWHKTYMMGRRLLCESIERLREVAPVTVISCPGNHDTTAAWCLADAIECYFRNTKDVDVQNAPTPRKYLEYGRVLLGWTHGNAGKSKSLPMVMASEQREAFGRTIHHEFHTGDKHQTKVEEFHGVRVRISPALCPPDAWHSENHFIGNARSAEAYVWDRDEGLVNLAVYTVPQ